LQAIFEILKRKKAGKEKNEVAFWDRKKVVSEGCGCGNKQKRRCKKGGKAIAKKKG